MKTLRFLRIILVVGLGAAISATASCHSWMQTVYKGRPPNELIRLSGEEPVQVRVTKWVHPNVFEGEYEYEGEPYVERFIQIEQCRGYKELSEGTVALPNWVFTANLAYSSPEDRKRASDRIPAGTVLKVSFPLADRKISNAAETQEDGVRVYQGYLIRIDVSE